MASIVTSLGEGAVTSLGVTSLGEGARSKLRGIRSRHVVLPWQDEATQSGTSFILEAAIVVFDPESGKIVSVVRDADDVQQNEMVDLRNVDILDIGSKVLMPGAVDIIQSIDTISSIARDCEAERACVSRVSKEAAAAGVTTLLILPYFRELTTLKSLLQRKHDLEQCDIAVDVGLIMNHDPRTVKESVAAAESGIPLGIFAPLCEVDPHCRVSTPTDIAVLRRALQKDLCSQRRTAILIHAELCSKKQLSVSSPLRCALPGKRLIAGDLNHPAYMLGGGGSSDSDPGNSFEELEGLSKLDVGSTGSGNSEPMKVRAAMVSPMVMPIGSRRKVSF